jgi:glycosyltransferase involved in cell wall biosynthesis
VAKVLRIIARLNVGGPARHVVWLTAGMKPRGYETLLIAGTVPPGEDDMSYVAEQAGVTPSILPQMSREISANDVVTVWKLFRLMLREQPQLVHTHTAKAGTVGRAAGFLYRWLTPGAIVGRPRQVRFVHTYHGHVFHSYYGPAKTRLFLTIERMLARLVTDRVIVITEQQRREINEDFRVGKPAQFAVIPLGIDLELYANWADRRDQFRRELGVPEDEILIGIVGRLTEIKNHEMFLQVAAQLQKSSSSKIKFLIIGDGHLRSSLESMAAQHQVADRVLFLGSRSDPENFYPALDMVALTSLNEGTPLSIIEGMANARPVVATTVGGVRDLIGRQLDEVQQRRFAVHERGLGVASGDVAGFAEALAYLVGDEPLRQKLGDLGRAFVLEKYGKDRLVADMCALYGELLHTAPGGVRGLDAPTMLD